MLNFMWKFSLRVYAQTNKNIYKKGCCQTSKVIMDSEPRVAALFFGNLVQLTHVGICNVYVAWLT